ncbi:MAG: hypothetical protein V2A73_17020, partial [Pseudomonadota bacterium]
MANNHCQVVRPGMSPSTRFPHELSAPRGGGAAGLQILAGAALACLLVAGACGGHGKNENDSESEAAAKAKTKTKTE